MKVVYGHTDSIYVQMPMDKTKETVDLLNNHVRQKFPNLLELDEHPVTLEFEKYFKSLGVGTTKNRNAGLISWKDGVYLDEPEFTMTGFAAKRVAINKLAKDAQSTTLKMWVEGSPEHEVTAVLKKKYNAVLNNKTTIDFVSNRTTYRPARFTYKCKFCNKEYTADELVIPSIATIPSRMTFCNKCGKDLELTTLEGKNPSIGAGVEGVLWWNQNHDNKIVDSYVYVRVTDEITRQSYRNPITQVTKRPKYISAPSIKELPKLQIDAMHYAEQVVKKAKPIYEAMNWDVTKIRHDIHQRTLDEFGW